MKKLLSIALCAVAAASFGGAEIKIGEIGVTKIDSGMSNTIVAVSYEDLGGGEIAASNLVKTTNLSVGDQLMIFKGDGQYTTWSLDENKRWASAEKSFSLSESGEESVGGPDPAPFGKLTVGSGFWLVRSDSSKPFYIYGKPSTNETYVAQAGKWNLIGNPNQTAFNAANITGVEEGDEIRVSVVDRVLLKLYKVVGDGWKYQTGPMSWEAAGTISIPAGTGFWFKPKKNVTIDIKTSN